MIDISDKTLESLLMCKYAHQFKYRLIIIDAIKKCSHYNVGHFLKCGLLHEPYKYVSILISVMFNAL